MWCFRNVGLHLALIWLFLGGCASPIPHAVSFPATTQPHMQAAAHWDLLAKETAEKIAKRIVDGNHFNGEIPAIVPDEWNCPSPCKSDSYPEFHRAYRVLLASNLEKLGFSSKNMKGANLEVRYETQWVRHHSPRKVAWPRATLVSSGIVAGGGLVYAAEVFGVSSINFWGWPFFVSPFIDLADGYDPGLISDSEVVVTTSMTYLGRVVFSESKIFYVNAGDRHHFVLPVTYAVEAIKE